MSTGKVLWFMLANEGLQNDRIDDAKGVIKCAFRAMQSTDSIWAAAAKAQVKSKTLAIECGFHAKTRSVTEAALVWIAIAIVISAHGSNDGL